VTIATALVPRWDLSDLYLSPDDTRWASDLEAILGDARSFADTYRGAIAREGGPEAAHLLAALIAYEDLQERASRAGAYARLLYSVDTRDEVIRELVNRAERFSTELRNHLLFFDLEWLDVAEADAARLMAEPSLSGYANYLRRERLDLPHKLSEPEERIVNEKDLTGRRAWSRFFQETTSALTFALPEGDGTRTATLSETLARMYEPDRETRRQAHDALYAVLEQNAAVLTFTFDTLVQDHLTMDRIRRHPDPMHERHLANDIAPEAVRAMMRVVEESYPIAHRYWRAKAAMIGLDRLLTYDQYAPVGGRGSASWDEARRTVLEALDRFDRRFGGLAAEFYDRNWIDAEPRPGKRGGAFCAYPSPKVHPYVMCNFTGGGRDITTIAHELGHAIHGQFARGQTLLNYHAPLPLAETASVFAEMIVFEALLDQLPEGDARRGLIAGTIENIFATVFRQNVLTRFEEGVYAARGSARLTTDGLARIWIDANRPYYGDALTMTDGYRLGWSYIPHFINSRFYCYAYTFGELLVLALYATYREQGAPFVAEYVRLLELGGSVSPEEALRPLGVDIADPSFWRRGIAEIERLIDLVAPDEQYRKS